MDIKDSRKLMSPPVVIGGAVAVVVLVAIMASVSGTGTAKSASESAPHAASTASQTVVPAQPRAVAVQPSTPSAGASSQVSKVAPVGVNIQYRPALPLGTTVEPGIEIEASYSGGQGSQMAQIFKGINSTDKYDITTNLDQIKVFALPNQSAKLEVISSAYILAPSNGEYTISVMETCERSVCQMSLILDDTSVPLVSGESGSIYSSEKVTTPYTAAVSLQAGYHKLKVTQGILRPAPTSSGSARVLLKGPADSGLLDALVYLQPKS